MTTPQEHDVAQVMLALRCTTGVAAKDVDDCHPAVRDMAYTQARHALADPRPLLDALLGTVARCDVCDEPCDDLHSAEVDGEHLDVCWRCCPCCPTSGGAVCIPADPVKREALANFAGLDAEERAALDQFCFDEEQKRARGVLLHDNEPREAT